MELVAIWLAYGLAGEHRLAAQVLFWVLLASTARVGVNVLIVTGILAYATVAALRADDALFWRDAARGMYGATLLRWLGFVVACILLYVLYRRIWQ